MAYKLDSVTKRLKSYNKSLKDIETDLLRGDTSSALNKWTHPFRKVETSFIEIGNHRKLIDALEGFDNQSLTFSQYLTQKKVPRYLIDRHASKFQNSTTKKYLTVVKKDLDKYSKTLGNNIDSYLSGKDKMRSLLSSDTCSSGCKEAIRRVLRETSITSNQFREGLSGLVGSRRSIDTQAVKHLFETDAKAFLISKRKIFVKDIAGRLKSLFNNRYIMKALFMTGRFGSVGKTKLLLRMFKRGYNHKYFKVHRPFITKVSYSDLSPSKKIKMLQNDIGELDLDEVLADFSRASEGKMQNSFDEILAYAESKPALNAFYNRAVEAQKFGAKLGKISKTSPRNYDWLIGSLVLGGAGLTYLSFDTETTELNPSDTEILTPSDDPEVIEIEFESDEDSQLIEEFLETHSELDLIESAATQ